jgi:diacylglycerol O-acyltransferase
MATRRIRVNDAAWLFAEGRNTPMHVGVLATFALPADAPPGFLRELVARWRETREFAPPFNYRLRLLPLPAWEELSADRIDLDYHLRHSALPAPGGERELGVLVSRLHSQRLDRTYPLWEAHLIEGLADRRFALYVKMHHSQIDGVGGVRMLRRVLSADPDRRHMPPPWQVGARGASRDPGGEPRADRGHAGLDAVPRIVAALGSTARDSIIGPPPLQGAAPYRAPTTIFNGRVHGPRRFATQHYELQRIRTVAAAAGTTVNDVFLAVCAGAVRRYLQELDSLPARPLTALLPVSVRSGDDGAVGNAISFVYSSLATDVADPMARLHAIHASTQAGKARLPAVTGAAMDAYTALLMAPYLGVAIAGLGGFGPPSANLVLSNVPGPAEPLYLEGARLAEMYPVSLLFDGQALNITVVSYAGQFNIGYTGCRDSLPHMQRLAVYSGEALAELEDAAGRPAVDAAGRPAVR